MTIPAIILAAGESKRLGWPKQLINISGIPLLRHIAMMAIDNCQPVIIVLGSKAEVIKNSINGLNVTVTINTSWHDGIASSIRKGMEILPNASIGVLFLVCDQIHITHNVLKRLTETCQLNPDKIVASFYANTCGVPAYFPSKYFNILNNLDGDIGANKIIKQHFDEVVTVEFSDGAIDIDCVDDLMNYFS